MALTVSRETSLKVQRLLDDGLPPFIRDSRLFMSLLLRLAFGRRAKIFMQFKQRAHRMTAEDYADLYREVADVELHAETHLNGACLNAIVTLVQGEVVLEAGCGRGYLAGKLAASNQVTGVDIVVPDEVRDAHPTVAFSEAGLERLPFEDSSFDTVVCTHTLEHVVDIRAAVNELRRVARRRLLIVVPKQRPYKYGFNLHLHFFPYPWSFPSLLGYHEDHRIVDLGDWLYIENH